MALESFSQRGGCICFISVVGRAGRKNDQGTAESERFREITVGRWDRGMTRKRMNNVN